MNALILRLQQFLETARFYLRTQRVTITSTNPLKVTLADGTVVPAIGVTGLTYTVGQHAVALIADRSQPVVLPTA